MEMGKSLVQMKVRRFLGSIKWDCSLAGVGGWGREWDGVNLFSSYYVPGTVLGAEELATNKTVPYSLGDRMSGAGKLRTVRGVVLGRAGKCRISLVCAGYPKKGTFLAWRTTGAGREN